MASKIEWTDETWNPVTGCTPVSEGCEHCYAKRMATRLRGRYGYPQDDPFKVTFHPDKLEQPLKWKKPRMVFVCSMGDLFHEDVLDDTINEVFEVMAMCRDHIFQVLTKRPERMLEYCHGQSDETGEGYLNEGNVWLGVTAENQARADERIPTLLKIPAAVHFVSIEPCLGPLDITPWLSGWTGKGSNLPQPLKGALEALPDINGLDWVIVGGETGPGARPMHPDWARGLRDQCVDADVPFFFKQWGDWVEVSPDEDNKNTFQAGWVSPVSHTDFAKWQESYADGNYSKSPKALKKDGHIYMDEVGKKRAGRLLDGREWNGMPRRVESPRSKVTGPRSNVKKEG